MPSAAQSYCTEPRCPNMGIYRGRCKDHARKQERTRYNAATRKWYSSDAWKNLRAVVLSAEPVCTDCRQAPSTLVDHKVPHRGDYALFWDRANLAGMCVTCHGRKTARGE